MGLIPLDRDKPKAAVEFDQRLEGKTPMGDYYEGGFPRNVFSQFSGEALPTMLWVDLPVAEKNEPSQPLIP